LNESFASLKQGDVIKVPFPYTDKAAWTRDAWHEEKNQGRLKLPPIQTIHS